MTNDTVPFLQLAWEMEAKQAMGRNTNDAVHAADGRPLRVGTGQAAAHHGEILQGVFDEGDGRLHRGLITLPCPLFGCIATFWPRPGSDIATRPPGRDKARRAVRLTLQRLRLSGIGGELSLESTVPMGHGYGSSTADVVAAIRAVAAAARTPLRQETIAALAVAAEVASDPLAFDELPILFAQREGRTLEFLGAAFPALIVVGCNVAPDQPVDTLLTSPARYDSDEIETFRVLRGLAAHAIAKGNARLLGNVATASARISQQHLPQPLFDEITAIARATGACGIQVAHSGTLIGLLFDGAECDAGQCASQAARHLETSGLSSVAYKLGVEGAGAA
jgi:uncharacterized protein involved in propanediol utilization